jgi:hypothetical protein
MLTYYANFGGGVDIGGVFVATACGALRRRGASCRQPYHTTALRSVTTFFDIGAW